MTSSSLKSGFLNEMRDRLLDSCDRAKALAEGLDAAQINWKPDERTWSIAQCYDHVRRGADDYAEVLEPLIERARESGRYPADDPEPRHSSMGRLIIAFVEPCAKRKMKSPKSFAPSASEIPVSVVDRFVTSHGHVADLVKACDGIDPNRLRMSSPELRVIRMNVADAFAILAMHAERHLAQAERVHDLPNFPA